MPYFVEFSIIFSLPIVLIQNYPLCNHIPKKKRDNPEIREYNANKLG